MFSNVLIKISKKIIADYSNYFKFIQPTINQFKQMLMKTSNNSGSFVVNFEGKDILVTIYNVDLQITKYDSGIGQAYERNQKYYIDIYGDTSLDIDWYIDTFQHQLMHLCQLYFGYANKNQKKSWNKQKKYDYMQNFNEQIKIPFNEKLQSYYTDEDEFSQYLVDAIKFFKKLIQSKKYSQMQIVNILKSNIWNDKNKLKQLIDNGETATQSIYFLYFWHKKDKNKFNKIINKILKHLI